MKLIDQETVWSKDGYRYTLSAYVDNDGRSIVEVERETYNDKQGYYHSKKIMWREERILKLAA